MTITAETKLGRHDSAHNFAQSEVPERQQINVILNF